MKVVLIFPLSLWAVLLSLTILGGGAVLLRTFLVRTMCTSLPRQLSQSTERVFLAVSDGHVCRHQSKLAHTNASLFITEDTRPE